MKQFRELYFKGNEEELNNFINEIKNYTNGDWYLRPKTPNNEGYLLFDYNGQEVDKAMVSIYIKNRIENGEVHVGNIVPLEKDQLTIEEYNNVLIKFYKDVIKPYKDSGISLDISEPTNDEFDIKTIISKEALDKLELFCNNANKTTGSSHPCDRERWFDFICQTVVDNTIIATDTLAKFLQDESYWNKKPEGFIGSIGKFAWDEYHAYELADEYESLTSILIYYRENRWGL